MWKITGEITGFTNPEVEGYVVLRKVWYARFKFMFMLKLFFARIFYDNVETEWIEDY